MNLQYKEQPVKVGVQFSNVLASESNVDLAFALQLAKIDRILSAKRKNRESLVEFQKDWELLERLSNASAERKHAQNWFSTAGSSELALPSGAFSAAFQ